MLKRYSPFVVVDVPSMGEVGNAVVVSPAALDIATDKPIHQHDQDYDERLQVRGVGEPLTYPSPITVKVEMREDDGGDYILLDSLRPYFSSRELHEDLGSLAEAWPSIRHTAFDLSGGVPATVWDALRLFRMTVENLREEVATARAGQPVEAATEVYQERSIELDSKLSQELRRTAAQEKEIARLTQALQQREREFHAMLLGYRMLARLMGEAS